jgi:hypothetical protein
MLYPPGYSFHRPFSYKREYLSQDLQDMVADPAKVASNLSLDSWNTGYVGIRFGDSASPQFRGRFIPLRKVTLTAISVEETIQIFLRLGDYVLPSQDAGLGHLSLDGIIDHTQPENTLFFTIPSGKAQDFQAPRTSGEFPPQFWDRLMAHGTLSPKAQASFKDALVLRLRCVRRHGTNEAIRPIAIETRGDMVKVYGVQLKQRRCYDLDLVYQRLAVRGEGSGQLLAAEYQWMPQGDVLKIAQPAIPVTGNYRAAIACVEVQSACPAAVQLGFMPPVRQAPRSPAVGSDVKGPEMCIWASLTSAFWSARRVVDLLLAVLFLSVSAFLGWEVSQACTDQRPLWLGILATPAALFVSFLKDFIAGGRK